MVKSIILAILILTATTLRSQNLSVTFSATGAADQVETVTAKNMNTGWSITLPGNETLILSEGTGIPAEEVSFAAGTVYPNPFTGRATFRAEITKPQTVTVRVQGAAGQVVAQTEAPVAMGTNQFSFSIRDAGFYIISLITEEGISAYPVIATEKGLSGDRIDYLGSGPISGNLFLFNGFKSAETDYSLAFSYGDIIRFTCKSGIYTTILTDSPASSGNYEVEFFSCIDPDGKSYATAIIGNQVWMAGNLAYLPSVGPPAQGSDTLPYYYVQTYTGSTVSVAKNRATCRDYGVLYNWPAAVISCPQGWHLPSDDEWKVLEKNFGMSDDDVATFGRRSSGRVGSKLKEEGSIYWKAPNLDTDHYSGFMARGGGGRFPDGEFYNYREYGLFWTSTLSSKNIAWIRDMLYMATWMERIECSTEHAFSVRCLRD
jgi:uncharacterized protein (TIGR02145 family)